MKFKLLRPLSLCLFGLTLNAAVVHVSGFASGNDYSDQFSTINECSQSFSGQDLGGVSCDGPYGTFQAGASAYGDRFSGMVHAQSLTGTAYIYDQQGEYVDSLRGSGSGTADLDYAHTFYLSGGQGQAILNLDDAFIWGASDGLTSAYCQISINGQPGYGCGGDFAVSFFAPIHLTMYLHVLSSGCCGSVDSALVAYDLSGIKVIQDGNVVRGAALQPVPEPASVLSVAAGLAVLGLRRRRW